MSKHFSINNNILLCRQIVVYTQTDSSTFSKTCNIQFIEVIFLQLAKCELLLPIQHIHISTWIGSWVIWCRWLACSIYADCYITICFEVCKARHLAQIYILTILVEQVFHQLMANRHYQAIACIQCD